MRSPTDLGSNKTGTATAPVQSARMPTPGTSAAPLVSSLAAQRIAIAKASDPIGSMPPPLTLKGMAKTAIARIKGQRANTLLDKLGARAAFERSGTRLYDALLSKYDAFGTFDGGPSRAELELIRGEELAHFHLVVEAIEALGGDPTAVTPSADRDGVMSMGLVQTLSDPRSSLAECLEAILVAELVDNDCWTTLISLSDELGQKSLAEVFERSLAEEVRHLASVRQWLAAFIKLDASAGRSD